MGRSVDTTGVPAACASICTRPKASLRATLGRQNTSAAWYQAESSSSSCGARKGGAGGQGKASILRGGRGGGAGARAEADGAAPGRGRGPHSGLGHERDPPPHGHDPPTPTMHPPCPLPHCPSLPSPPTPPRPSSPACVTVRRTAWVTAWLKLSRGVTARRAQAADMGMRAGAREWPSRRRAWHFWQQKWNPRVFRVRGSGFDSPRRQPHGRSLLSGAWEITSPGTGRTLSESSSRTAGRMAREPNGDSRGEGPSLTHPPIPLFLPEMPSPSTTEPLASVAQSSTRFLSLSLSR